MSAMERVITIGEAGVLKSGHSKKGAWTLSVVKDSTGKGYTTFKDGLRELAQGNIGAEAKILFTENGDRVTLEGLEILTEATHSPSNGTGDFDLTRATRDIQNATGAPWANSDDRQLKIMRQTAAKVAAHIEAVYPTDAGFDPDVFFFICEKLIDYFENGVPSAVEIPFGAA